MKQEEEWVLRNGEVQLGRPIFAQMNVFDSVNRLWQEQARWLKYQEIAEEGGRWSQPHVPSLSVFFVQLMRQSIREGAVILDSLRVNYSEILDDIIHSWTVKREIGLNQIDALKEILMQHQKPMRARGLMEIVSGGLKKLPKSIAKSKNPQPPNPQTMSYKRKLDKELPEIIKEEREFFSSLPSIPMELIPPPDETDSSSVGPVSFILSHPKRTTFLREGFGKIIIVSELSDLDQDGSCSLLLTCCPNQSYYISEAFVKYKDLRRY